MTANGWRSNEEAWTVLADRQKVPALVNIVIPTRNRSDKLQRALASVLLQARDVGPGDLAIWVADNCSSDGSTRAVAEDFARRFAGNVHYHRHAEDLGLDGSIWSMYCAIPAEWFWFCGDRHEFVSPLAPVIDALRSMKDGGLILNCWLGDYEEQFKRHALTDVDFRGPPLTRNAGHTMMTSLSGAIVRKRVGDERTADLDDGDFTSGFLHARLFCRALTRGPVAFYETPLKAATLDPYGTVVWPLDMVARGPNHAVRGYESLFDFSFDQFDGFDTAISLIIMHHLGVTRLEKPPAFTRFAYRTLRERGVESLPALTRAAAVVSTPRPVLRTAVLAWTLAKHRSFARASALWKRLKSMDKAHPARPK